MKTLNLEKISNYYLLNNSICINNKEVLNIEDIVIFKTINDSFVCVIEDIFLDEEEQKIMINCDTGEVIYLNDIKEYFKY